MFNFRFLHFIIKCPLAWKQEKYDKKIDDELCKALEDIQRFAIGRLKAVNKELELDFRGSNLAPNITKE